MLTSQHLAAQQTQLPSLDLSSMYAVRGQACIYMVLDMLMVQEQTTATRY